MRMSLWRSALALVADGKQFIDGLTVTLGAFFMAFSFWEEAQPCLLCSDRFR
jgi:hypothetical protein